MREEPQAIIGLSFGTGFVNNFLVSMVLETADYFPDAYLVLQKELVLDDIIKERADVVIRGHRVEGKYLDTIEVLEQAKIFLFPKRKKVILIAHPDHLPRATRIASKLGYDVIRMKIPPIPYDALSRQIWTKNRVLFKIWDLIASIQLLFLKL